MEELIRRNISGIYIFDEFPNEDKRQPTCIEDCQQETRRKWCMGVDETALRDTIEKLAESFKELCNFLVDEKCVSRGTRHDFFEMIDRNVRKSKLNWAKHELADQVDFFCEKIRLLADACSTVREK